MSDDNLRERVFRRMLAREAGTTADASAIAAAARRLYEQLAQQLTPLIGGSGAAAIFARSLHLTHRQRPGLAPVRAPDDQEPIARAQRFLESQESAAATDAAIAVLMTVCELLESFIGSKLTTDHLRQAWPDDFGGDTTEETPT